MPTYLRALGYYRRDGGRIAWLFVLQLLQSALGLAVAWPLAVLVDSVLAPAPKPDPVHRFLLGLMPEGVTGRVIGLALVGLVLRLLQELGNLVQRLLSNHVNYAALMRLRTDLLRKLQRLHLGYHESRPPGETIYRVTSDTFACQTVLGVTLATANAALVLVAMVAILWTRSAALTVLAFSVVPLLAVVNVRYGRTIGREARRVRETDARFLVAVQRSLDVIGLTHVYGRYADEIRRLGDAARHGVRAALRLVREEALYWLLVGVVSGLATALLFAYGGLLVHREQLAPGTGITIGDLMIYLAYLGMLWDPLCRLTGAGTNLATALASVERVLQVLDQEPHVRDAPGAQPLPLFPRSVRFEDVWFGYDGTAVLSGVDLEIPAREFVAFVGPSGAGKTTCLNLIPRFYDPTRGRVLFDERDARSLRVHDLRRHVALVMQHTVLLPATVRENVAYGNPAASPAELREAARLAGAEEFIDGLPEGWETVVGEAGLKLSGGQEQRIHMARALLSPAPILLLDEPTSALDPESESWILDTLRRIHGARTIVVVSHRYRSVALADRVVVFSGGRIEAAGPHHELLTRAPTYARLFRHAEDLARRDRA